MIFEVSVSFFSSWQILTCFKIWRAVVTSLVVVWICFSVGEFRSTNFILKAFLILELTDLQIWWIIRHSRPTSLRLFLFRLTLSLNPRWRELTRLLPFTQRAQLENQISQKSLNGLYYLHLRVTLDQGNCFSMAITVFWQIKQSELQLDTGFNEVFSIQNKVRSKRVLFLHLSRMHHFLLSR